MFNILRFELRLTLVILTSFIGIHSQPALQLLLACLHILTFSRVLFYSQLHFQNEVPFAKEPAKNEAQICNQFLPIQAQMQENRRIKVGNLLSKHRSPVACLVAMTRVASGALRVASGPLKLPPDHHQLPPDH